MSKTTIPTGGITADAINGTLLADDAINSEHYTDGSIDTAHVADSQITAAKTSGIGGRATLIDTITLSNTTTAVFDNSDVTSTYDNYLMIFEDIQPGSGNVEMRMQFSIDNGSNFQTTGDYRKISFNGIENESNNGFTSRYGTSEDFIAVVAAYTNTGNDAALQIDGHMYLYSMNSGAYKKTLSHMVFGQSDDPPKFVYENAAHLCDGTQSAINYIKIFMSSGNMANGKIKLFGLA